MKRALILGFVLVFAFSTQAQESIDKYTIHAVTKIVNDGYQTIADSLRVGGAATFNSTITANGKLTGKAGVFSDSARTGPLVVNGATTANGKITGTSGVFGDSARTGPLVVNGLVTLFGSGYTMKLRTIAAGDSVFGHTILDVADTTLKCWNGTSWKTLVLNIGR